MRPLQLCRRVARATAYRTAGVHAAETADLVVVVGSFAKMFWPGLRDGGFTADRMLKAATVGEATALLRPLIREGDVVLLKGRSNRKLARIALALQGREVRCALAECWLDRQYCDSCRYLRTGPFVAARDAE